MAEIVIGTIRGSQKDKVRITLDGVPIGPEVYKTSLGDGIVWWLEKTVDAIVDALTEATADDPDLRALVLRIITMQEGSDGTTDH